MTESTELLEEFKHLFDVVKLCYQCGTCAGGCPVFKQYGKFNPRRVMEKLLLGDFSEEIFDEQQIWYCTMCFTCSVRCPQGIDIGHVITEMKNMAVKEGYIHSSFAKRVELVGTKGKLFPVSEFDNNKRKELGLPPIAPTNEEVPELFKLTGLCKLVEKVGENKE